MRATSRHITAMRFVPLFIAALALALGIYSLDLLKTLGAHPFWSQSVLLIGWPLGLGLGCVLVWMGQSRLVRICMVLPGLLAAFGLAQIGKRRFAASYAEDALAGQMWYFGWIATCVLAAALVAIALWPKGTAD